MVAFYKRDIPAWREGTRHLSDRAYRVYDVIVAEIMIHEGPFRLHERQLAGESNRSVRDLRAAIAELVEVGKIHIDELGFIHNARCQRELDAIFANRANAAKGGAKRAQKTGENSANGPRVVGECSSNGPRVVCELTEKPNDFNADEQATLDSGGKPKREEKSIYTEAKASDAEASDGLSENAKGVLFGPGLKWVAKATGSSEPRTRSLIGQWLKIAHNDADSVLAAVRRAKAEQPAEPKAFISGILRARHAPKAGIVPVVQTSRLSKPAVRA